MDSQDTVEEAEDDEKRSTALALENLGLQRAHQQSAKAVQTWEVDKDS